MKLLKNWLLETQAIKRPGGLFQDAGKYVEVEIPAGSIITVGFAARQGNEASRFIGGGSQIWIPQEVVETINWNGVVKVWNEATGSYW